MTCGTLGGPTELTRSWSHAIAGVSCCWGNFWVEAEALDLWNNNKTICVFKLWDFWLDFFFFGRIFFLGYIYIYIYTYIYIYIHKHIYIYSISVLRVGKLCDQRLKTLGFERCYTIILRFSHVLESAAINWTHLRRREVFSNENPWKSNEITCETIGKVHLTPLPNLSKLKLSPQKDATILGKLPGSLRNGQLIKVDGWNAVRKWMIRVTNLQEHLSKNGNNAIFQGISKNKYSKKDVHQP